MEDALQCDTDYITRIALYLSRRYDKMLEAHEVQTDMITRWIEKQPGLQEIYDRWHNASFKREMKYAVNDYNECKRRFQAINVYLFPQNIKMVS